MCRRKNSRVIKEQEDRVFLTGLLGVNLPFEGIPILANII